MNNDLQEIEVTIEEALAQVRRGELVLSLEKNPEFRELVLEGYFRDDAARVVMLLADKEHQSAERQTALHSDLVGISTFGEYLRAQKILGNMAAESIEQHKATREDILGEIQ